MIIVNKLKKASKKFMCCVLAVLMTIVTLPIISSPLYASTEWLEPFEISEYDVHEFLDIATLPIDPESITILYHTVAYLVTMLELTYPNDATYIFASEIYIVSDTFDHDGFTYAYDNDIASRVVVRDESVYTPTGYLPNFDLESVQTVSIEMRWATTGGDVAILFLDVIGSFTDLPPIVGVIRNSVPVMVEELRNGLTGEGFDFIRVSTVLLSQFIGVVATKLMGTPAGIAANFVLPIIAHMITGRGCEGTRLASCASRFNDPNRWMPYISGMRAVVAMAGPASCVTCGKRWVTRSRYDRFRNEQMQRFALSN